MASTTADEIHGREFDWLASDADGHVGLFSTAGAGFAPKEFLEDVGAHDRAIDAILAAPSRTTALTAPQLAPGLENTWQKMAERGVYAFDSDPNGGPYRRVAVPEQPISLADLPEPAAGVVARMTFPNLRFAELRTIPLRALGAVRRREARAGSAPDAK